ncbi:MAG: hypothetical protein LBH32_13255 [Dysgonamonadaceae bacterium]|jgi:hypothetical protein|nr:hypothetical protein [Dysgonamonadaceae bacterium]
MQLAALIGEVNNLRGAFKTAANAAAAFGYSAEEGMDAMQEAARQGISGNKAVDITRQVFNFERNTGADRGTLMGIATLSTRYGAGNALGMGWAGLQASGMKQGQYSEYLRAMQRVMEEGISKGFVLSSAQVVQNLTTLSQMTGNNPLWQGENGARRLSEMNAGLASATSLSSATDILAFRGAQAVLNDHTFTDADWKKMVGDQNKDGKADIKRTGDYIDAMIVLEKGLTTDLFTKQMEIINNAEGGGRTGSIERIRQMYGLNYFNSAMLYDTWKSREASGNPLDEKETEKLLNTFGKTPPTASSPELDAARMIEEIKNLKTDTGQAYWDDQISKIIEELRKAKKENDEVRNPKPADTRDMSPADVVRVRRQEYEAALKSGDAARIAEADRRLTEAERAVAATPDPMTAGDMKDIAMRNMLIKSGMPWDKDRITFFTGDGNPLTKNDDEQAYDRFMEYEKQPVGSPAHQAYNEATDILGTFTPKQIASVNESNSINAKIPDVMTDKTGQKLLEVVIQLKDEIEHMTIREEGTY